VITSVYKGDNDEEYTARIPYREEKNLRKKKTLLVVLEVQELLFFRERRKNLNCSPLSRFFQRPTRAKHNTIDLETKLSFGIRPRSSLSVSSAPVRSLKTRSLGFPTLDSSVFRAVFYSQLVVTLPKFTRAVSKFFAEHGESTSALCLLKGGRKQKKDEFEFDRTSRRRAQSAYLPFR